MTNIQATADGDRPRVKAFFEQTSEPPCITIDFDGTLISEHVLICWVLFLLRHSGWPVHRKFFFAAKSIGRGLAALVLSRRSAFASRAVRAAFGTFQGVEKSTLAALVHCHIRRQQPQKRYVLNLNPRVLKIAKHLVGSCRIYPRICVTSQGSCREVIELFLNRADVRDQFRSAGIAIASVAIYANGMETDGRECFTGGIRGEILTKFNRMVPMAGQTIFIGDDADEKVYKRVGPAGVLRFVNWRRWTGA